MTTVMDLPLVTECTVAGCSYNHDGCHAGAITVGGSGDTAECETFVPLDVKGGLEVLGRVGACTRTDCVHNTALECTATTVVIAASGDTAGCRSFTLR
jgi:hypothetical protein